MNAQEFMEVCEKDRRGPRPKDNDMSIPERKEQTGSVTAPTVKTDPGAEALRKQNV